MQTRPLLRALRAPPLRRRLTILSIETSCDDTSVALLHTPTATSATLLFHETITSPNRQYGGIHPLVSLESHRRHLAPLLQKCISSPGFRTPDLVAATRGPGMVSSLAVGLDTAKGLAVAWRVPFLGVHHMQAHALTPRLVAALDNRPAPAPRFPFLTFLVSGGHTMLLLSSALTQHRLLANTMDVAVGDMLDKAARLVLPAELLAQEAQAVAYGALLERFCFPDGERDYHYHPPGTQPRALEDGEKLARWGDWKLTVPLSKNPKPHFRTSFSFCGLGSGVERYVQSKEVGEEERRALGREVMMLAFEHLASRVVYALESLPEGERRGVRELVVSGGVASNRFLRHLMRRYLEERGYAGVELVAPPLRFCTDNAAMIAWAAAEMWRDGWRTGLEVEPVRKWSLEEIVPREGAEEVVGGWIKEAPRE